jgi:hypothetical protein
MRRLTSHSRITSAAIRRDVRRRRRSALPTAHCPLPTSRRGISLLEILISMFVLLFGLMGVAAIFPVGNHYAVEGEKYDRDVALADAAFAELAARGMLRPDRWLYAMSEPNFSDNVSTPVISQVNDLTNNPPLRKDEFAIPLLSTTGEHPGYAFVIDPLGTAAGALEYNNVSIVPFPWFDVTDFGASAPTPNTDMPAEWTDAGLAGDFWPIKRVTLDVDPRPGVHAMGGSDPGNPRPMSAAQAESIFRLRDDLSVDLPAEDDRPGIQPWLMDDVNNTPDNPADDVPLARQYKGAYSWLATVVPTTADDLPDSTDALEALQPAHPGYGQKYYDVSVAVFHKRSPATPSPESERSIAAELLPGGELVMWSQNSDAVDAAVEGVRPGHWIAVAGVVPSSRFNAFTGFAPPMLAIKWYRLLSLDDETLDASDPQSRIVIHDSDGSPITPVFYRRAMLDGPDWPNVAGQNYIPHLRALIMPGVIGVSTRSVKMEVPNSLWSPQHFPLPGAY